MGGKMKKFLKLIVAFNVFIYMISVSSCSGNNVKGTDGMLAYMCAKHGDGLKFSGSVSDAGETLAWFSFDETNPTCTYMVFKNKGNDEYEPLYDPNTTLDAGACQCIWHNGIVVHIEDRDIFSVQIVSGNVQTYSVTEYPFNLCSELSTGEAFVFCMDKDGNVIESIH